jgi:predicted DNA binding CopG/RHH family protein
MSNKAKDKFPVDAEPSNPMATSATAARDIVQATLSMAASAGLIHGKKNKRLSVRVSDQLLDAAAAQSGLHGSELIQYALAKVALEDDFARRLLAREGSISGDVDLGF